MPQPQMNNESFPSADAPLQQVKSHTAAIDHNSPRYTPMFNSAFGQRNQMYQPSIPLSVSSNGKGKERAFEHRFTEISEDQWEAEFARASAPQSQIEELDPILDHEDPALMDLDGKWRDIQSSLDRQSALDKEMAAWEAQYGSQFVDPESEFSPATEPFNIDDLLQNPPDWDWLSQDNMFKDHPDPFLEGQRLLEAGAPFIEVEQAFEEACKRDQNRSEAWTALGETLAADEKELLAIRALERAVASNGQIAGRAWLVRSTYFSF